MYASHDHQLDGFLELVLVCYPLQVFVYYMAHLGAGITGFSLNSRVRLPAVIVVSLVTIFLSHYWKHILVLVA